MHNYDRTQLESDFDEEAFEAGHSEVFEAFEYEDGEAFADDAPGEMMMGDMRLDEEEEMELAAELLEVIDDEQELEQFFIKRLRRAFRRTKKARRRIGRRLVKGLVRGGRRLAKHLLPIAGRAVGTKFGGPIGGKIGGSIGDGVGKALGLELEGLSPEDQDFAVARQIVRMTGEAMAEAMAIGEDVGDEEAADMALRKVMRRNTPSRRRSGAASSGRWVRRGGSIVLMGA